MEMTGDTLFSMPLSYGLNHPAICPTTDAFVNRFVTSLPFVRLHTFRNSSIIEVRKMFMPPRIEKIKFKDLHFQLLIMDPDRWLLEKRA